MTSPVVFFTFNRPELTRRVFETIRDYRPEVLFLVSDGPRPDFPEDETLVRMVREIIAEVDWPCEVHEIFAEANLGMRTRFFSALDRVFDDVSKAIILEDDCLPSSSFFSLMEMCLDHFEDLSEVGTIAGSNHFVTTNQSQLFFTLHPRIWGWGTWAREWNSFKVSGFREKISLQTQIRALWGIKSWLGRLFFLNLLLNRQALGTWDIDFALFERREKKLVATSPLNLVENLGLESGSSHAPFARVDWRQADEISGFEIPKVIEIVKGYERAYNRNRARMISKVLHGRLVSTFSERKKSLSLRMSRLLVPREKGPKVTKLR